MDMKKIICIAGMILCLCLGLNAQNTASGDLDSQYATELLKVGTAAPDFAIPDAEGNIVKLSDYKGKYVVIDFWASWCRDCRADIPAMKEAFGKYGTKVVFLGVSFDDNREAWITTVRQQGLGWTQVSELKKMKETAVAPLYKIGWIPTMYVIDPQGKVVLATVMVEKMTAKLAEITGRKMVL